MAESPAHELGEAIGIVLEGAIRPLLSGFATERGLYLDLKGHRPARQGLKLSWVDKHGNSHDLDYVIERGGTESHIGDPVAFIECAWRRYTKHSRNKAQEIQGAILPLAETYRESAPFLGAILAGEFTQGSLDQLRSVGFQVVCFSYASMVESFAAEGFDIAYREDTSVDNLRRMARAWSDHTPEVRVAHARMVAARLVARNQDQIDDFMRALQRSVSRRIEAVQVIPLHGRLFEAGAVQSAIDFITDYSDGAASQPIVKYEVIVRFSNGDRVDGSFGGKRDAIAFLRRLDDSPD